MKEFCWFAASIVLFSPGVALFKNAGLVDEYTRTIKLDNDIKAAQLAGCLKQDKEKASK